MIYINLDTNTIEVGNKLIIPYDLSSLRDKYKVDLLQVVEGEIRVVLYSKDIDEGYSIDDFSAFKLILEKQDISNQIARGVFEYKLEKYIYNFYPEDKQGQDDKWLERSRAAIVATMSKSGKPLSSDVLTTEIVEKVIEFFAQKKSANAFVTQYADTKMESLKPIYAKLLNVSIRAEWCKKIIDEAKLASFENREPKYIAYPFLPSDKQEVTQ